jgi:hypothetical protein
VGGFLAAAPSLLSVHRTRNLAAQYPERVRGILAEAAAIATTDGKDARWKPLAKGAPGRPYRAGKVDQPGRLIGEPAALMLRLRLAFGVHARSDVLAFLLSIAPSSVSAREVGEATGYGPMPARRALEAMVAARIVRAAGSRPERYHAEIERWASLMGDKAVPVWRYWRPLFGFLAAALPSVSDASVGERSAYLLSSDKRRLVLEHRAAFSWNRIAIPESSDFPGEEYLAGYDQTLLAVSRWLEAST